ncbi:MAG: hypothetical protein VYE53_13425 [Planctomycetota bacterium]|nr:hypothetical protein [Planctomycetota bacterium]
MNGPVDNFPSVRNRFAVEGDPSVQRFAVEQRDWFCTYGFLTTEFRAGCGVEGDQ